MCADKFRKTAPLKITFADAEQPTGSKLSALANQSRNGLALLESAVGDIWNQSGDIVTTDYPLQIANIARMLGETKYLNPSLYPGEDIFEFAELLGDKFEYQSTGHLLFHPTEGTVTGQPIPTSYNIIEDNESNFITPVSNEYEVNAIGKFWIDATTGRFRVFGTIQAGDTFGYQVDPTTGWVTGEETLPGVIPDPKQSLFAGVRISSSGGRYYLHLPPRLPLTFSDREKPNKYPTAAEIASTYNKATAIVTPAKLWQSSSIQAITGVGSEHYRYRLSKEILDQFSALAVGSEYPAGMLFLWSQDSQTIVEGIRFYKPFVGTYPDYVIEVQSDTFDFDPYVTTTENSSDYDSGFSLIVCGSPVSRSIWNLATSFYRHDHSNNGTLEDTISHNDLDGLNPPVSSYTGHSGRYPTAVPTWHSSRWANDGHTSLLSRAGSQGTGGSRNRDINDNAMLGNLVLANATAISGDVFITTTPTTSHRLYFGGVGGPSIYASSAQVISITESIYVTGSASNLITAAGTGSQIGVYATTETGSAVKGVATGSYGIGIYAESTGSNGKGIYVEASASSGIGIYAFSTGSSGRGITTRAEGSSGIGILAESIGSSGKGIYVYGTGSSGYGIYTTVSGSDGIGISVSSSGTNGIGIESISNYNYALTLSGHSSGGSSGRAAVKISPQAADPSTSPAKGDIYVNNTTGRLRVCDGNFTGPDNGWGRIVTRVYSNTAVESENAASTVTFNDTQYLIPANTLTNGTTFRLKVGLIIPYYSGAFSVFVTPKITIFGTELILGSNVSVSTNSSYDWHILLDIDVVVFNITGGVGSTAYAIIKRHDMLVTPSGGSSDKTYVFNYALSFNSASNLSNLVQLDYSGTTGQNDPTLTFFQVDMA